VFLWLIRPIHFLSRLHFFIFFRYFILSYVAQPSGATEERQKSDRGATEERQRSDRRATVERQRRDSGETVERQRRDSGETAERQRRDSGATAERQPEQSLRHSYIGILIRNKICSALPNPNCGCSLFATCEFSKVSLIYMCRFQHRSMESTQFLRDSGGKGSQQHGRQSGIP